MEIELKRCPFCGKQPNLHICSAKASWIGEACNYISCSCGIMSCYHPTPQGVADVWNRRVGEEPKPEPIFDREEYEEWMAKKKPKKEPIEIALEQMKKTGETLTNKELTELLHIIAQDPKKPVFYKPDDENIEAITTKNLIHPGVRKEMDRQARIGLAERIFIKMMGIIDNPFLTSGDRNALTETSFELADAFLAHANKEETNAR